jgi:Domain of unknown function (DUF4157)
MPNREFDPITGPVSALFRSNESQGETSAAPVAEREAVDRVACRAGDNSCAQAHASTLNRATDSQPARAKGSLLQLQRQYGNRYVERVLALAREGAEHNEVSPSVEQAIQQKRGGGQTLDSGLRRQMESSLGANFSGVRVHTDQQSDSLNRSLSARAFTTGQDIFFRQDAYQPGSSAGRELLAHELTHVVQQGGDQVRRAMSVSQPTDPHEVEAEQTARAVMEHEHSGLPGAGEKEKEKENEAEHHAPHMMASRCPCDAAQRQPEAPEGKHKKDEDEEKKKHHVLTKADAGGLLRRAEVHHGSE